MRTKGYKRHSRKTRKRKSYKKRGGEGCKGRPAYGGGWDPNETVSARIDQYVHDSAPYRN